MRNFLKYICIFLLKIATIFIRIPNGYYVLVYHSVTEKPGRRNRVETTLCEFRAHLQKILQHYSIVTYAELVDRIQTGKKPQLPTFAISFDDGYRDNLNVALPVLKDLNVPAIFFICPKFVLERNEKPWWDYLDLMNKTQINILCKTLTQLQNNGGNNIDRLMETELKSMLPDAQSEICLNVAPELANVRNDFLTYNDLKNISQNSQFEIGAHTMDHVSLGRFSDFGLVSAIDSKLALEKITGKKIQHFAFPYGGKRDMPDDRYCERLQEHFESIATTKVGNNFNPGMQGCIIDRVDASVKSFSALEASILLGLLRQYVRR